MRIESIPINDSLLGIFAWVNIHMLTCRTQHPVMLLMHQTPAESFTALIDTIILVVYEVRQQKGNNSTEMGELEHCDRIIEGSSAFVCR